MGRGHPVNQTETVASMTSILGSNLKFVLRARETRHNFSAFFRRSRARSLCSEQSLFSVAETIGSPQ